MLFSLIKISVVCGGGHRPDVWGDPADGSVRRGDDCTIAGVELTLSPLQLAFALGCPWWWLVWLGLKLLKFLIAAFKFLNGDETAISRYFDRNREKEGLRGTGRGHDGFGVWRGPPCDERKPSVPTSC